MGEYLGVAIRSDYGALAHRAGFEILDGSRRIGAGVVLRRSEPLARTVGDVNGCRPNSRF